MTITCRPVDPEAMAISAPYVNGFQISTLQGGLVRIAFAEALAAGRKETTDCGDDARARREGNGLSDLERAGQDPADAVVSDQAIFVDGRSGSRRNWQRFLSVLPCNAAC